MTAVVIMSKNCFGHCSCPDRFRKSVKILEERIFSGHQVFPCIVTVPPVIPSLEDDLKRLSDLIGDREDTELVLNDWGTLSHCAWMKKQGLLKASLTAGVLLAGQDTDPLIGIFCEQQEEQTVIIRGTYVPEESHRRVVRAVWKEPTDCLQTHWKTPSILEILPLLKEMEIGRIELCAQPMPFPEHISDPDMAVTFIRESILSVIPCTGNCHYCRDVRECIGNTMRGNQMVMGSANLIFTEGDSDPPVWADRVTLIRNNQWVLYHT